MKGFLPLALTVALFVGMGEAGSATGAAPSGLVPRRVVALYDSASNDSPRRTRAATFLEMPLNHLGYDVVYQDVRTGLPPAGPDVAAILVWFERGSPVPDPRGLLSYLKREKDKGRKLILFDTFGIPDKPTDPALEALFHEVAAQVGVRPSFRYVAHTHNARVLQKDSLIGFERPVPLPLPPFNEAVLLPDRGKAHLVVTAPGDEGVVTSAMIVTGPGGAYLDGDYAVSYIGAADQAPHEYVRFWHVDPFRLLETVFADTRFPVPDVTTLNGRRIFYSHIDGDGWNNRSEVEAYRVLGALSSEVVGKEIFAAYPQLGFTVGLIGAEVDPGCQALRGSAEAARAILALPNVEAGSHTYSHPFHWGFFESGDLAEKEKPYHDRYPPRPQDGGLWGASARRSSGAGVQGEHAHGVEAGKAGSGKPEDLGYTTPRAYACSPFSLEQEFGAGNRLLEELSGGAKKVGLVQWSGNTSPFAEALRATRQRGLRNINGGDSRMDARMNSMAWLAPIGTRVGDQIQIYASNANDFIYTDGWSDRYYGFRDLVGTLEATENPRRLKPMNLYFHMYSGQKEASLQALKANIAFVLKTDFIPVWTTEYAAMADGFYSAGIRRDASGGWSVRNRDGLATLRLDGPLAKEEVDYAASRGILGARRLHESLYVALDPAVPEIFLKTTGNAPKKAFAWLESANWVVRDLSRSGRSFSFETYGFGAATMLWHIPRAAGRVRARVSDSSGKLLSDEALAPREGLLDVTLPDAAHEPRRVKIEWEE